MPVKQATIQDLIDQLHRLKEVYGDLPVVAGKDHAHYCASNCKLVMGYQVSMLWDVTQWEGQGVLKVG